MKKLFLLLVLIFGVSLFFGCTQSEVNPPILESEQVISEPVVVSENPYSGTCPRGKVDEVCLGECGNFIDTDKDGSCDRAQ
jgi:hypothetical protein